jgi:urease accessory protein UreF
VELFGGGGDASAPLARQMAKLLASSDLDELREVIERWLAEAPTDRVRRQYQQFGAKMLELKRALVSAPQQPSEEELELALRMMLKLAAEAGPDAKLPKP